MQDHTSVDAYLGMLKSRICLLAHRGETDAPDFQAAAHSLAALKGEFPSDRFADEMMQLQMEAILNAVRGTLERIFLERGREAAVCFMERVLTDERCNFSEVERRACADVMQARLDRLAVVASA